MFGLSTSNAPNSTFELIGEVKRWQLQRVKVLGKGSFGMATLVRDVTDGGDEGSPNGSSDSISLSSPSSSVGTSTLHHRHHNNLYVAKEINLQCMKKPKELENLQREINILKSVSHPNVVRYVDCSQIEEASYVLVILMEYCDGGDLHDRIKKSESVGGMNEDEVASVLIQILVALKCLHMEHRILHRDLKPQNIFMTKEGVVKIGDFGVSTVLTQSVDMAKTFCGSPYYLAPELVEEKPYNGKADMWSVGVILYECMSGGKRPFSAKNLVALVMQICKAQYDAAPLAQYSSELSEIVSILLQRLAVNRPTFARLMRNRYIQDHFRLVPISLLQTSQYEAVLGSRLVQKAIEQKHAAALAGTLGSNQLSEELQAWADSDKNKLQELEEARGLGGPVIDPDFLTERQKRAMHSENVSSGSAPTTAGVVIAPRTQRHRGDGAAKEPAPSSQPTNQAPTKLNQNGTSPGRRSSSGGVKKGGTSPSSAAAEEDDDTWNSKYEDDFEELEPVSPTTPSGGGPQGTATTITSTTLSATEWSTEEDDRENEAYEQWTAQRQPSAVLLTEQSFNFDM